jgi:hypothetical protein
MAKLNIERSKALAGEASTEQKACWTNAYRILTNELPRALYVEGFAVEKGGFVFEHGWLEDGDDILDPTLYGNPPAHYVPGLRFTQQQIDAEWKKHGDQQLPITHARRNEYPDYLDAWAIAFDTSGVPGTAELARLQRAAAAQARKELAARQPPEP